MNTIDLHVHSTYSDGTCTPKELIALAEEANLCCMALTDHDTVEGLPAFFEAAKHSTVKAISGVELSSANKAGQKQDVHILGLGMDYENKQFLAHLQKFQNDRLKRNQKMCENLHCAGYDITFEALQALYPDAVITRCHIARYLTDHGYIESIEKAFSTLIGSDCPYYVPRFKITPAKAVSLIKEAHGTAVLAHPLLYGLNHEELCELIEQLKQFGLDGIEAIYSCNEGENESYVRSLAEKYHLAISGGSDFHGSNKPEIKLGIGKENLTIPDSLLAGLGL